MNADVESALREFMHALGDVTEARREYIKAISTAHRKSEELSTLLEVIIQQPHIDIVDCEIDG